MARWEAWAAELLESQLSYQVLSYFRSQHEKQSWLAALTAMMDSASVWQATKDHGKSWQARRLYAMGRHALGDLSQVLRAVPEFDAPDRMSQAEFDALYDTVTAAGIKVDLGAFRERLTALRNHIGLDEPFECSRQH